MPKPKTRAERIFELISSLELTNAEKQSIVKSRYNRKHVSHLTAQQGDDLEKALIAVEEYPVDKEKILGTLQQKQEHLWTANPLFPTPF